MAESVALCAVVGGAVYERYAEQLFESAREFFYPSDRVEFHTIPGEEGWPNGTLMRYHRLLENMPRTDHVFLCDADMLFQGHVGSEILPTSGRPSLVLTLHPGYVGKPAGELPFEDRPDSACYVPPGKRRRYYCGAFVGGDRREFTEFARQIKSRIDHDLANGMTPCWVDESAVNATAVSHIGDKVVLSPAYCHPDRDDYYLTFWSERYPRLLVALDKTAAERAWRDGAAQNRTGASAL